MRFATLSEATWYYRPAFWICGVQAVTTLSVKRRRVSRRARLIFSTQSPITVPSGASSLGYRSYAALPSQLEFSSSGRAFDAIFGLFNDVHPATATPALASIRRSVARAWISIGKKLSPCDDSKNLRSGFSPITRLAWLNGEPLQGQQEHLIFLRQMQPQHC